MRQRWTKELALEESKKYSSRTEIQKNNNGLFKALKRLGLMDSLDHLKSKRLLTGEDRPNSKYTDEELIEIAKRYKTRQDLHEADNTAYREILTRKLDVAFEHMIWVPTLTGDDNTHAKYNKEELFKIALQYKTKSEWQKKDVNSYSIAKKRSYYKEITAHMEQLRSPNGTWTEESVALEAQKYSSRTEFYKKSGSAYNVALKLKIMDKICVHMEYKKNPDGTWNPENLFREASKYKSRIEFYRNSPVAYGASRKLGILEDISGHMNRPKISLGEAELMDFIKKSFPTAKTIRH